jgi:hypothetical protein
MPTRTRVSREALPLMSISSSHSTTPFSKRMTMVEPPGDGKHSEKRLKQVVHTEGEVTELFTTLDLFTLLLSGDDRTHHHRAYANRHNPTELRAIDGDDLPGVLTVHVQGGTDSLGLDT